MQATEGADVDAAEAPAAVDEALAAVTGPSVGKLSAALGGTRAATPSPILEASAPAAAPATVVAAPQPEVARPPAATPRAPDIDLLGDDVFGNGMRSGDFGCLHMHASWQAQPCVCIKKCAKQIPAT